jgi:hypothetical protein
MCQAACDLWTNCMFSILKVNRHRPSPDLQRQKLLFKAVVGINIYKLCQQLHTSISSCKRASCNDAHCQESCVTVLEKTTSKLPLDWAETRAARECPTKWPRDQSMRIGANPRGIPATCLLARALLASLLLTNPKILCRRACFRGRSKTKTRGSIKTSLPPSLPLPSPATRRI